MKIKDIRALEACSKFASAEMVKNAAARAMFVCGEMGRKRTIINVDDDMATVIFWAISNYLRDGHETIEKLYAAAEDRAFREEGAEE